MWFLLGMAVGAVSGAVVGTVAGYPFGLTVRAATFGMIVGSVTGAGYFTVFFDQPPKLKPYPMFTFTFIYVAIGLGTAQMGVVDTDSFKAGVMHKRVVQVRHVSPSVLVVVALSSGSLGLLVGWDIRRRLRSRTN